MTAATGCRAPKHVDMSTRKRKLLVACSQPPQRPEGRWTEAFFEYLTGECRLAANTIVAYRRDIRRFQAWLAGTHQSGL